MTVQLDLPEDALSQLRMTPDELDIEVRLMMAARMYEKGLASTGRAAEVFRIPRTLLLSRLASFGVELVSLTSDALREEAENAYRGR